MFQENPLKNIRKVDCALLPPCSKTLSNKLRRAQYISRVWGRADSINPNRALDPEEYGWKKTTTKYVPIWYNGSPLPDDIFENSHEEMNDYDMNVDDTSWSDDSDAE